jgi:nitrogen fixation NifU-like protein
MKENQEFPHKGRMNDPTSSAMIKGICGDEMEFYLFIRNDVIKEVKFYTENGCNDTLLAGNEVAECAKNKNVIDALEINPKQILDNLGNLPEDGRHCAILAVSTFYKAIADYLIKP